MEDTARFNESQQRRILASAEYIDKLLADIEGILDGEIRKPRFGALHPILVTPDFVRVASRELAPEHWRGCGAMAPDSESALRGVCNRLEGLASAPAAAPEAAMAPRCH